LEQKQETELVIPSNWVKDNFVLLPTVLNANALEDRREPKFPLVKVKLVSGKYYFFNIYEFGVLY